MKRRLFSYRTVLMATIAGLILVLAGDRGTRAQGIPTGIDPLEVLNLQIKPNVLVVLDTSGSMNDNLREEHGFGADYKHSKMGGAKRVLRQAVATNSARVNFLFGQYRQEGTVFNDTNHRQNLAGIGIDSQTDHGNNSDDVNPGRFSYWMRSDDCGATPCPNLRVNPIYAFQTISSSTDANPVVDNNMLYFVEEQGANDLDCSVAVAPGFYKDGGALATALTNAMNNCPGRQNRYDVAYDSGSGRFRFSLGEARPWLFRLLWSKPTSSIGPVLNAGTGDTSDTDDWSAWDARYEVLKRNDKVDEKKANAVTDKVGSTTYIHYEIVAGRFWNGETIYVLNDGRDNGTVCGQAATVTPLIPAVVRVQPVNSCSTLATNGPLLTFEFAGGKGSGYDNANGRAGFEGNPFGCKGFKVRVQLASCEDNPALQATSITTPYLQDEWDYEKTAGPTYGQLKRYKEVRNGTGEMIDPDGNGPLTTSPPPFGLVANGSTPIARSLRDIKELFTFYWNGAPPLPVPPPEEAGPGPATLPASGAISRHASPKERTLVLFITDGDDTCEPDGRDKAALASAKAAEQLYKPLQGSLNRDGSFAVGTDPASSVTTFMVGYGLGASADRLDWIAWGGSGMQEDNLAGKWTSPPSRAERRACATCIDAFIAPDAATLAAMLQSIFDQSAAGEFTAQQSLDFSPHEYVDRAGAFRADDPATRYRGLTPTRFLSSFELPGFKGHLKALQSSGGANPTTLTRWDAGQLLTKAVQDGIETCARNSSETSSPLAGKCVFSELHGNNADHMMVNASSAKIKRRIYTTRRNGYFGVTISNLLANTVPASTREVLWPPTTTVAPTSDSAQGILDPALGLPLDSHPRPAEAFADLQRDFKACLGTPLASASDNCNGSDLQKMQRARREAREMILAFMAGAEIILDDDANPTRSQGDSTKGEILYRARSWMLADSTLATPAVVGPPLENRPNATPYLQEYDLFRDGPRPMTAALVQQGFGLRNPDRDLPPNSTPEAVMTVAYAPANDMLHAFRAGPNMAPSATCGSSNECGGQELWGFVPFDRLGPYCVKTAAQVCPVDATRQAVLNYGTLGSRLVNNPQRRDPHDYMIARGVRVADVFVRGTTTVTNVPTPVQGLWRRVLLFGRGAGGKFMTGLDITSPGSFTLKALETMPPIPLWNRGNPDTVDGTVGGVKNRLQFDYDAYAKMGQTWSLPAIGYAKCNDNGIRSPTTAAGTGPKPATGQECGGTTPGVEFVGYMGSGYGGGGEGSTFYAFDVLTGDIVSAQDLGQRPSPPTYANAIVANAAAYSTSSFQEGGAHPLATYTTRVYVGDVHGRVWKFLTAKPDVPIPMADLGASQPVGTAVSLLGFPPAGQEALKPHVYVTSGNDSRAGGPFGAFGFRDEVVDDTSTTVDTTPTSETGTSTPPELPLTIGVFKPTTVLTTGPTPAPPLIANVPFIRTFDTGARTNPSAPPPDPVFRGTAQPATALALPKGLSGKPLATAFFAGTRFNPLGSAYAPRPIPGQPATYPCRSTFDTIIYVLEGDTGSAAYDLNDGTQDDAYAIFKGSRTVAIGMKADPGNSQSGSKFERDEGILKEFPGPPPPPGLPPGSGADVRIVARAGRPLPTLKFGSTVCQ